MKNEFLLNLARENAAHYDCNGDGTEETCSGWCNYKYHVKQLYEAFEKAYNAGYFDGKYSKVVM